ncbi:MAG: chemotaxis protein CheW [Gammaproteobacteria bacterium]|nr:chemotaxis protein CheW [Gammaproteobacteria bacterium]
METEYYLPAQIGQCKLAFPLASVQRVLPLLNSHPLPGAPSFVSGVVNIHETFIPIVQLAQILNLKAATEQLWSPMVWVQTEHRQLILLVDSVSAPVASAHKDTQAIPERTNSSWFNGILALDSGMLLIHDLETLLSDHEGQQIDQALFDFVAEHCQ